MDKEKINKLVWEKEAEESMKQEFLQSLPAKVKRYSKVNRPYAIPYHHFAPASGECTLLFRDGHFYGCITLVQSVAEAIVRFLCESNGWRPAQKIEQNLNRLYKRGFISSSLKLTFIEIWNKRDNYHHLLSSIETDSKKLEELAKEKLNLLGEAENEIFSFDIRKGAISPKKKKYWKMKEALLIDKPVNRWEFKRKNKGSDSEHGK